MKKKLLVLLGAGSSVRQGMPSVTSLNELVRNWAADWAKEKNSPDYYDLVWKNRENYLRESSEEENCLEKSYTTPNYERCLGDLLMLLNACTPKYSGDPLLHLLNESALFKAHGISPTNECLKCVYDQFLELIKKLAGYFRQCCLAFENKSEPTDFIGSYTNLFDHLRSKFDLGVYNLNHDTVALKALPDFFTGFNSEGLFQAANVHSRPEWNFLYHLHGCVKFTLKDCEIQNGEIPIPYTQWQKKLADVFTDVPPSTLSTQLRNDFRKVILTTIVAGGWKLDQIQAEPFQSYYSTFSRHAYEADAILIGGYGFGDEHVNSVLSNALRNRDASRPPVMVLDYNQTWFDASVDERPSIDNWDHDNGWSYRFKEALDLAHAARSHFDSALNQSRAEEYFEFHANLPVSVWFMGFQTAANQIGKISRWLNQPDKF